VQVFVAPVRAASSGLWRPAPESNHGGSVPSMESETLRQRSDTDGLPPQHHPRCGLRSYQTAVAIWGPPQRRRFEPVRERQAKRMVPVRLHGDHRVMMHVTLTTRASRFVKPADAAGRGPLDPILGIRT
jgi:hypothetical protein